MVTVSMRPLGDCLDYLVCSLFYRRAVQHFLDVSTDPAITLQGFSFLTSTLTSGCMPCCTAHYRYTQEWQHIN